MKSFSDEHPDLHGVEPICKALPIPRRRTTHRRSARPISFGDHIAAARCTVRRLTKRHGPGGVIRGREVLTTVSDPRAVCAPDHIQRQCRADRPNALWLSEFTHVLTWQGFACVAFVIDKFARWIVGWQPQSCPTRCEPEAGCGSSLRNGPGGRLRLAVWGRVTARSGRGYGPQRIRAELRERGINGELADVALAALLDQRSVLIREVWHKKFRGQMPADYRERARQMRFLQQRGFFSEDIRGLFADVDDPA